MENDILSRSFNIQELTDFLSKYPKDMKIIITWESTYHEIEKKNIYLSKDKEFLYFDADDNFYKKDFAFDPHENE